MSTITGDAARGCGRALVLRLLITLFVLPLACVLVIGPVWFMSAFDFAPWTIVLSVALFLVVFTSVGVGIPVVMVLRRKAQLDRLFEPLGLEGSTYQTFFRQYHGTMHERQVDVYLFRGPVLELEVRTPLQTRLGVTGPQADTRFLARLMGREPLVLDDPALADLIVFALDETWARALLDDPRAVDLLRRLVRLDSIFTRQQVILRPGALQLVLSGNRRLFGLDLAPTQVRAWLDGLLELVRIAESLPAPQETAESSPAERLAGRIRRQNPYLTLWIGVGTFLFFIAMTAVIVVGVLLFAS
jgi:hypothetical protein